MIEVVIRGLLAASNGFISDAELEGKSLNAFMDTAITSGTFIHAIEMNVPKQAVLQYKIRGLQSGLKGKSGTKVKSIRHIFDPNTAQNSTLHDNAISAILAKKLRKCCGS